jgi:hypothetical protein
MRFREGRSWGWVAILVLAAVVPVAEAAAQEGTGRPPRGQGMSRSEMEQQVRFMFGRRMMQELDLSQEEFEALQELQRPFQERRRALGQRERATRLRIAAYLQDGGREGEADELLAELASIRADELSVFQDELEAVSGILDPDQQLRFVVLRDQLNQRIQRARWQAQGTRGGPPPGGIDASPHLW